MTAVLLAFVLHAAACASAQTAIAAPAQAPPASQQPSAAKAPALPSGVVSADRRGPLDVNIIVFGEPLLSGRVRVGNDGTIPFQALQRVGRRISR
jgi:hypothetical protein